jgi:hypothetical protein
MWEMMPSRHGYIIANAVSGLAVDANGNTDACIDQNTTSIQSLGISLSRLVMSESRNEV